MYIVKQFLLIGVLALPLGAQTNPLLPAGNLSPSQLSTNVIPPSYSGSTVGESQPAVYPGRTLYRWSIAAVLAANVADAATSWRSQEANPVVAGTGSQFGMTSVAIKTGFVASSLLIQHIALRHRPDFYKRMAWLNLITAGAFAGVAGHNLSVR